VAGQAGRQYTNFTYRPAAVLEKWQAQQAGSPLTLPTDLQLFRRSSRPSRQAVHIFTYRPAAVQEKWLAKQAGSPLTLPTDLQLYRRSGRPSRQAVH